MLSLKTQQQIYNKVINKDLAIPRSFFNAVCYALLIDSLLYWCNQFFWWI